MLKEKILGYIRARDTEGLKVLLSKAEEMEILQAYHDISPKEQVIVFRLLDKNRALSVFEQLDTDEQQTLLKSFTDENVVEYVNEMAPDDRVRLLDEMPATVAKKLLNSISATEREATNAIMGYKEETAGRIMTTEFVTLNRDMTAEEALAKVRKQAADKESVYTLYVTGTAKKLEGVLSLKDLVCAKADAKIEDFMTQRAISVTTDTDQEVVARSMQELDLLAMPIVDSEGRMVGIVTIDDAMDILEDEATEDMLNAAGFIEVAGKESVRSEVLVKGSLWKIWKVRLPFLVITLTAGMLAGLILEGFEDILESVVIVAFFIPLIMDMGGNVGTQSSTLFARGVVLGHIDINRFLKPFIKELFVGLSMGSIVGAVSGVIIAFWIGIPMLGIAVGIALVATMTLAAVLGFFVPYLLIRLKADQAAGASPIITSIKDISGLFIYFGLIYVLMSSHLEPSYEVTGQFVVTEGAHFFIDMEDEIAMFMSIEDYEVFTEVPYEIEIGGEVFPVVNIDGRE